MTTGECVEALVTTILMGCHTLYRAADTLEPFDCELAFQRGETLALRRAWIARAPPTVW